MGHRSYHRCYKELADQKQAVPDILNSSNTQACLAKSRYAEKLVAR